VKCPVIHRLMGCGLVRALLVRALLVGALLVGALLVRRFRLTRQLSAAARPATVALPANYGWRVVAG